MSKMTAEQRKAEGWESLGWAVKYPVSGSKWHWARTGTVGLDERRKVFASDGEAHKEASFWGGAKLVRLWHRPKPKAPPPLKVGDEVMVRGVVADGGPERGPDVRVDIASDTWPGRQFVMVARRVIVR